MLTDFPDCFSRWLGVAVCFDATTGFFVAGAGFVCTGFVCTGFPAGLAGAGFAAGLMGLAGLPAGFFAATTGRFVFAADFAGALRALVLLRAGAAAFFARPTGAGLFFAIACVHLETRRPRVIA